ncbi:hypothetical protein ACG3SL_18815 [Sphingomonas sp. CJ20]
MLRIVAVGVASLFVSGASEMRIAPGGTLSATVAGVPAQLRLDPGAPSMPIMNPDFAARAQFDAGLFGSMVHIGPVRVSGRTAVIRYDLGQGAYKRRTGWFDAPVVAGADGLIGPGSVPAPVVRFDLHSARTGERAVSLPLVDFGFSGMGVRLPVADVTLEVRFTLERDESLATAAAGAALAEAQGGQMQGAARAVPILLGVSRPVRTLALETPFAVGPLSLRAVQVRTGDFGSTDGVADADKAVDPDEILVTAQRKQKHRTTLTIGRAALSGCSAIVFDKPAKRVTLYCQ